MEETLQASLNAGEEILWRGRAEPFETLDKTHKADFIRKLLIAAAIVIAFAAFLIGVGGMERKTIVLILIILVLCAIPVFNMLGDASKLRKIEYIVTSERLIVLRDAVRSAYFSQIKTAVFKADPDGHVSLLCGPDAVKAKPQKYREICVVGTGAGDAGSECERFCFYAPADRKALEKILHEKMPSLF